MIVFIVVKVLFIGVVGIIGIIVFVFVYVVGDKMVSGVIIMVLSELNSLLIWFIVVVFMIVYGFIKIGLGWCIVL